MSGFSENIETQLSAIDQKYKLIGCVLNKAKMKNVAASKSVPLISMKAIFGSDESTVSSEMKVYQNTHVASE